ncbi:MAG: hypothetical protein FWD77_01455 [Betaproteobacteria bacterium]|nr:hypothetical protein [Betaproteobacteria bacterium]
MIRFFRLLQKTRAWLRMRALEIRLHDQRKSYVRAETEHRLQHREQRRRIEETEQKLARARAEFIGYSAPGKRRIFDVA